jgi:hypothetical protein
VGVVRGTSADQRILVATLSTRKLTPFIQCHVAIELEAFSVAQVALLIEMVEDRCMNRGKFLQTSASGRIAPTNKQKTSESILVVAFAF